LIVDDDQELCAMLAEYLAPEGFLTLTAGTGPAGLEQLGRAAVDLVVLDVMLPELSGFEVLRRIRAVSRVPVIMLTARGAATDRSLDTHVSNLRRKLMKHTDRLTLQSVRGSGYALTLAPARAPASQG